jgi:hypothetical protein
VLGSRASKLPLPPATISQWRLRSGIACRVADDTPVFNFEHIGDWLRRRAFLKSGHFWAWARNTKILPLDPF